MITCKTKMKISNVPISFLRKNSKKNSHLHCIVMMIIAWTSLLHATFESEGIDYYYYDKNGQPEVL